MDEEAEIAAELVEDLNGQEEVEEEDEPFEDVSSPFISAVVAGDLTIVQALLKEQQADMNETTNLGRTAMWHAAAKNHLEIMHVLFEHGADKEKTGRCNESPLWIACTKGHLAIVQLLLENGADIETADTSEYSPLIIATTCGELAVVRHLLEQGANRDKVTFDDWTSLHWAAHNGHLEIAKLLMSYGADLNARTRDYELPIDLADDEEIRQAIRDEPRRRLDEAPGKRATEQDRGKNTLYSSKSSSSKNLYRIYE